MSVLGVSAGAVSAAAALTVGLWLFPSDHQVAVPADRPSAASSSAPSADEPQPNSEYGAVPSADVRAMAETGNEISVLGDDAETDVTQAQAVRTARGNFAMTARAEVAGASLVRLTVHSYGNEQEPDPAQPSRLKLIIENRTVWMVDFADVTQPMFGPRVDADRAGQQKLSHSYRANLVVWIDAATGDFLRAESL